MFGDEGILIRGRDMEGREIACFANVPQDHADVAEKAGTLDALDGGLSEKTAEFLLGESEKVAQFMLEDVLPGMEAQVAAGLCEAVPGARVQAVITAVKAISYQGAQFQWDRTRAFEIPIPWSMAVFDDPGKA